MHKVLKSIAGRNISHCPGASPYRCFPTCSLTQPYNVTPTLCLTNFQQIQTKQKNKTWHPVKIHRDLALVPSMMIPIKGIFSF